MWEMISKVIITEGVVLSEGTITDVEDSYKYLGIPQANGKYEEASRKSATTKYLQRVRPVLKSQLNGKKKVRAINTYPPASHQIPCWHDNLAKGGDGSH